MQIEGFSFPRFYPQVREVDLGGAVPIAVSAAGSHCPVRPRSRWVAIHTHHEWLTWLFSHGAPNEV